MRPRHRQLDRECGAFARAGVDDDLTAVLTNDLLRDRQAQPVPRDPLLDAKIWKIEGCRFGSMPTPLSLTLIRTMEASWSHCVLIDDLGVLRPFAGIDGIGHDVQDGAMDSLGVDHYLGEIRAGIPDQLDAEFLGRDCINSTTSPMVSLRSDGSSAGSRSLENESMSMTML